MTKEITPDVFICAAKRTAIGSFGGALQQTPAPELAAKVIANILNETKLSKDVMGEVILGSVLTAGVGQAPARQASIAAGLGYQTQAMTVNKVCSSGLKAVLLGAWSIRLGHSQAVLAGGMENMSLAPYLLPKLRNGARLGHTDSLDSIIVDGLWDPYNSQHMGNCAELCAREFQLSREEQDAYALQSYERAQNATESGAFKEEIVPLTVRQGRNEVTFDVDEEPTKVKKDKVPNLKPVFDKSGTVTAANASSINDGAAVLLLCSENFVNEHSLTPLARILDEGWHSQEPEWFTTAPVGATEQLLGKLGKTVRDIDLFEVNEAFSAVALACQRQLGIPDEKLNIRGGAVALGHPIGASGARILTTLIHGLHAREQTLGVAAICNGGGEATSVCVERVK